MERADQLEQAAPAGRDGRVVRSIGGYRPGLDGVRALAVFAVLAYHAQLPHTSGGFLGVSLFFTLSGFLITGLLLDEHERTGTVDLKNFWIRRFRRLVPAALLGLTVAVIFAATIATRTQLDGLPGEVLSSAAYYANWFFASTDQSYAELFTAPSPVQHYWSLAIEEQFYLALPLVLLAALRIRPSVKFVLAVTAVGAVVSTLWMAFTFENADTIDRAYYGTDTRAAELLVGSTLAALLHLIGVERVKSLGRTMIAVGPLVLIGLVWAWTSQSLTEPALFRGGFLLHAIASAVLVVAILVDAGPLTAVLKTPVLAYLGRISYGIYLFHWPVFLWLTEERTELGQWPLFALRVAVAVTIASASFFLLEQPIRKGTALARLPSPARLAVAPVVIGLLFAGTVAATQRDARDDAATLRVVENPLGLPIATHDGVLDVLAIAAPEAEDVTDKLASLTADEETVEVVTEPFDCNGVLAAIESGTTCANWTTTWPTLIADHDPDVVVVYASDWTFGTNSEIEDTGDAEAVEAAAEVLSVGFDLLTSGGAPIIWASAPASFADDIQRSNRSFTPAMTLLEKQRDDLHSATFSRTTASDEGVDATLAAEALLEDAALYQRSDRSGLPKVLVVGDSQARSLGFGLQAWGDAAGTAWVWNRGAPGCSLNPEGVQRFVTEAEVAPECKAAVESFDRLVDTFGPDLVIVVTGLWDVVPRKIDAWDDFKELGDPDFDALLLESLQSAQRRLSAGGARVVWTVAPCIGAGGAGSAADELFAQRNALRTLLNETVLDQLFEAEPEAVPFDLDAALCPGGEPIDELPGVGPIRPDGVHFSVESSEWFARTYGPELLAVIEE